MNTQDTAVSKASGLTPYEVDQVWRSYVGTCPDCGGPLRQAFETTANYASCRRCGHVFPAK